MWRKIIFNAPRMKDRRKELRNGVTETEKKLWQRLRKSQLGYKFIRQYSIDNYVVDFYCPKKKLAIELDGGVHTKTDNCIYDKYRTEYLTAGGIKLVRFWNIQAEENIEYVVAEIKRCLISPIPCNITP